MPGGPFGTKPSLVRRPDRRRADGRSDWRETGPRPRLAPEPCKQWPGAAPPRRRFVPVGFY